MTSCYLEENVTIKPFGHLSRYGLWNVDSRRSLTSSRKIIMPQTNKLTK